MDVSERSAPGRDEDLPAWRARVAARARTATTDVVESRANRHADRLIAACRELLSEGGDARFAMKDLAARAELSLTTVYAVFSGKDELLVAVLEDSVLESARRVREQLAITTDAIERLRLAIVGAFLIATGPSAPGDVLVLAREHDRLVETLPIPTETAVQPLVQILVEELERAESAGIIEPIDMERDAAAIARISGAFLVALLRDRQLDDAPAVAAYLFELCTRALRIQDQE